MLYFAPRRLASVVSHLGYGSFICFIPGFLTPNISLVGFIAETIRFLVTQCSFHGLFSVDQFNGKLGFNYSSLWVYLINAPLVLIGRLTFIHLERGSFVP
jgi:hypothetical protein